MKTTGMIALSLALLALAGPAARPDDDPEPPPPIKVSGAMVGVKVKVTSGVGGPLLVVEGGPARGTSFFQLELPEKNPPAKITLRFKDTDRLARFGLMSSKAAKIAKAAKTDRALLYIEASTGKKTFHFDDRGQPTGEKGARLSFNYAPGKDQVEVIVVRHKGKEWPKSPFRVLWGQTFGKKKG